MSDPRPGEEVSEPEGMRKERESFPGVSNPESQKGNMWGEDSSCLTGWGGDVEPKQGEGDTWFADPLPCFALRSTTHLARYYKCICFLSLNHLPRPPPECSGRRDVCHSILGSQDRVW